MAQERVLIIEDEDMSARLLSLWLEGESYLVETAANGEEAAKKLQDKDWDLVFLDYVLPGQDGIEILLELKKADPELPVLFMTAHSTVNNAVEAMQAGATDYLMKPLDRDSVTLKARKALEVTAMKRQIGRLQSTLKQEHEYSNIAAYSPAMRDVLDTVETVAESEADTVLLLGESGVGKNLLAQAIHYNSRRSTKPFMAVTCTALPDQLLESELFGHERGAFTDAKKTHKGFCEVADGGTLFLDEIGDMPLGLQSKLLGFLEDRTFRRIGGTVEYKADVRVVAATNKDLRQEVKEQRFRADLFYRLNVIELTIPPLRDRREDIPLILNKFMRSFNTKFRKNVQGVTPAALQLLSGHDWPGNVRELRNMLERAMILTRKAYLEESDFPREILTGSADLLGKAQAPAAPAPGAGASQVSLSAAPDVEIPSPVIVDGNLNLEEHERALFRRAMELSGGNQTKAAELLGISRNQMIYRLKKFELA